MRYRAVGVEVNEGNSNGCYRRGRRALKLKRLNLCHRGPGLLGILQS